MVLRLKELRTAAGLSQKEAAARMGVSPSVLSNWEREFAIPRTRDLPAVALALGVHIDDLFVEPIPNLESQ